jgi:peptidoglycan/LPS O-acetylase OafA/YrhL
MQDGVRLASKIALTAVCASPLLRILVFALSRDGNLAAALLFDYVAAGSAIALLLSMHELTPGRRVLNAFLKSGVTPAMLIIALVLHAIFAGTTRWFFAVNAVLVTPIEAVLLAVFVAWTVRNPQHSIGRVLNFRPLRVVGVGSYSLYIWQQLFFVPDGGLAQDLPLPLKVGGACCCAAASYWIVERPSLRLRARLESTLFPDTLMDKREAGTRLHASPP